MRWQQLCAACRAPTTSHVARLRIKNRHLCCLTLHLLYHLPFSFLFYCARGRFLHLMLLNASSSPQRMTTHSWQLFKSSCKENSWRGKERGRDSHWSVGRSFAWSKVARRGYLMKFYCILSAIQIISTAAVTVSSISFSYFLTYFTYFKVPSTLLFISTLSHIPHKRKSNSLQRPRSTRCLESSATKKKVEEN